MPKVLKFDKIRMRVNVEWIPYNVYEAFFSNKLVTSQNQKKIRLSNLRKLVETRWHVNFDPSRNPEAPLIDQIQTQTLSSLVFGSNCP